MPAPITLDEEVWKGYISICIREAWTRNGILGRVLSSAMQPIPYGWTSIAGYWNYCDQYFNNIGIHDLVDAGQAKAADYADEATIKANYFHAQAMLDYFGEGGYNVLSEEETAKYQKMLEENQ